MNRYDVSSLSLGGSMRRREFIIGLGSAAAMPFVAHAQQTSMPTVGFAHIGSSGAFRHLVAAFRQGLAENDFVEGRNVAVEYRWADGRLERLPALTAELLRHSIAVLVCARQVAQAAKHAGARIPIVFVTVDDPVKLGFADSLNRPGGNMTGVYMFTLGLEAKRLGLLRDLVPAATTIAVIIDANYPYADIQVRDVQEAAVRLGVQIVVARVDVNQQFDEVFASLVQQRAGALLVTASPFLNNRRRHLTALAARHKLPAISEVPEFAVEGGLASYGNPIADIYRQTGSYAGRILKGEKASDLPIVQPTKFELVINLKTAKALGISIPGNSLTLADEVIE